MRNPQVSAWTSMEAKTAFDAYADEQGLPGGALLGLLITREMKLRRLRQAAESDPTLIGHLRGGSTVKVTVRHRLAHAFESYARDLGSNKSAAAGWLIDQELQDRWIQKVLESE